MVFLTDDIELLKECDAGVKLGIQGISNVINNAFEKEFVALLESYENKHLDILNEITEKLHENGASTKKPHPLARLNSKLVTNMKLMLNSSDEKIADIMMDGCNMGIKSVSRYMNEYSGASSEIMYIANQIVSLEQDFMDDLRQYL